MVKNKKTKKIEKKTSKGDVGIFYQIVILILLVLGFYFGVKYFLNNFHVYDVKDAAWKVQDDARLNYACKDIEYWFKDNLPKGSNVQTVTDLANYATTYFESYHFKLISIESKKVKILNLDQVVVKFTIYSQEKSITFTLK